MIYHIHGSADKVLPLKFIEADEVVKGGGHLMVYIQHQEVSKIIERLVEKLN